jgi:hypothetical protein
MAGKMTYNENWVDSCAVEHIVHLGTRYKRLARNSWTQRLEESIWRVGCYLGEVQKLD